jgi:hypothetical protein
LPLFYQKAFEIYKILQKLNIFARNHQIKKYLLFRCRHAVVIMQILNLPNQCSLFMTVRHIFEVSEDDHPPLVTHARDH